LYDVENIIGVIGRNFSGPRVQPLDLIFLSAS